MPRIFLLVALSAIVSLLVACGDDDGGSPDSGTDTDTDTDSDADVDTDTDTDIPENPCPNGQHAICYADDVWCADEGDTPLEMFDECTGGEQCVALSDEVAECQCVPDWTRSCYTDDVWSYDSCGEMDALVQDCATPAVCTDVGEGVFDCCALDVKQQCSVSDDVYTFHECVEQGDVESGLVTDCNDTNAECNETTATTAECQCLNHWTGTNCDVCAPHFDPAAECDACLGYWTGSDCTTCGGFGSDAEHCQCPDDTYVPQPGSDKCWTCIASADAVDGVCTAGPAGPGTSWTAANAACPAGFHLPSTEELMALMDDCTVLADFTLCAECSESAVCEQMYPNFISAVWTSDSCESDQYLLGDFSGFYYYYSSQCIDASESWITYICVK